MSSRRSGVGADAVRRRDGPAEVRLEPFVPPAVQHRGFKAAVQRRLHAAGAARLQRPQRVVQPDVAARVELLRHRHAVVGQEDDPVPDPGVVGEPDQFLDQALAAVVRRVRLARDHDLDRALGVQEQFRQAVAVAQHQRQALVGGHPAREADGQDVRVQDVVDPAQLGVPGPALPPRHAQPLPAPPAPAVRAGCGAVPRSPGPGCPRPSPSARSRRRPARPRPAGRRSAGRRAAAPPAPPRSARAPRWSRR